MAKPTKNSGRISATDSSLPTPLYYQVYSALRGKIIEREYADGDKFLNEKEVTEAYDVSRITARRALSELAKDGLVVRERGRGTHVTYKTPEQPIQASMDGMLENLLSMGLDTEVSLLEFGYITPTENIAQVLQCSPTNLVQHSVRVRGLDGRPFSYLTTYVPESIGRTYAREDLGTQSLLSLLEKGGVLVTRAEQTISAILASPEVAQSLDVALYSPLIQIIRTVYDQDNRPVEYIISLYLPDRYQYRMSLSRVRSSELNVWSQLSALDK